MLFTLWKKVRGKGKQTRKTEFCYEIEKDGIRYYFRSEIELSDEKLQKAADIIRGNVAKGVDGNATAGEVQRELLGSQEEGATRFSKEGDNLFVLEISMHPLAFC